MLWTDRRAQSVVLTGQVDTACDLMGAALADLKRMEVTENPVYITGRNLTHKNP